MHPYATHELAKIHQHELIAEADHARLVKEARLAARTASVPARAPLIWLRDVAGGFVARLTTFRGTQAGSH